MNPGEAYLALPHDQETAAHLLKMAEDSGFDPYDIRTTGDGIGYYVPDALVDQLYPAPQTKES